MNHRVQSFEDVVQRLQATSALALVKVTCGHDRSFMACFAVQAYSGDRSLLEDLADFANLTVEELEELAENRDGPMGEEVETLASCFERKWQRKLLAYLKPPRRQVIFKLMEEGRILVLKEFPYENSFAADLDFLWRLGLVERTDRGGELYCYELAAEQGITHRR